MSRKQLVIYLSIILISVAGTVFLWWTTYFRGAAIDNYSPAQQTTAQYAEDVLNTIKLLRSIQMDVSVFKKSPYAQLVDVSVTVERITPSGRSNPFLPF